MNESTAITEISSILYEMAEKMKDYKRDRDFINQLFKDGMRMINHIKIIGIRIGALDEYRFDGVYIDPEWIVKLVESSLNVDTKMKWRKREIVNARQYISYLLYKYSKLTFGDIAKYVGLTDHTSVLHHVNKLRGFLTYDEEVQKTLDKFEDAIILKYYEGNMHSIQALQRSRQAVLCADTDGVGRDKEREDEGLNSADTK